MNVKKQNMDNNAESPLAKYNYYPWVITLISAMFLFYKYVMQVSPSVMTHQWMQAFQIDGLGLGYLAATFFAAYTVTQIFVGVLLDRLSPRFLSTAAILTSAVGTFFFAESHSLTTASISRALMGVGAAFATVSYMKLTANWYRPERFALVGGLLATAAMLGAVAGQGLTWLIEAYGWRHSLIICGWFGVALAAIFIVFVRDQPKVQLSPYANKKMHRITLSDIWRILSNGQNWVLTFYSGLAFSPVAVLGGLWGNPFISEAYNLSPKKTASLVSLIFIGLAIGGPLLGFISDRLRVRREVMLYSAILSLVSISCVIYINNLPLVMLGILFFLFGFGTGAFMLGFAIGKEINLIAFAATVIALINTGDAIFGAITEPLIGKFLDLGWDHQMKDGVHYFSVTDYRWAFLVIPAYLIITAILVVFIKETGGKQLQHE